MQEYLIAHKESMYPKAKSLSLLSPKIMMYSYYYAMYVNEACKNTISPSDLTYQRNSNGMFFLPSAGSKKLFSFCFVIFS